MTVGWLLLVATLGSAVWVLFDAPRHGLSRAWSVGCLVVWVVFFPLYLVERADPPSPRAGVWAGRGLRGWLSRQWIADHRRVVALLLVVAAPLTAWGGWELRLLFRGPYMVLFVRHPALSSIPLIAGVTAFLLHVGFKLARRALGKSATDAAPPRPVRRSRKRGVKVQVPKARDGRPARYSIAEFVRGGGWRGRGERTPPLLFGPAVSALVCATLGLVFAVLVTASWTGAAIYDHTDYGILRLAMLSGGQARVKPFEVAQRQSQNGLNSPTERPTNLHIVKVRDRLVWTSVRDPEGFFRVLSKPTKGVMSVAASQTAPEVRQSGARYDADFRYGPGMQISDNIRWQVYKHRCYTCDVAEMTGVPTAEGPVIVAPYLRYEGNVFVRRPTLGGVYVVHPDGRIQDLSPAQAAHSALVRGSGRLFPEKLARRIADSYKFKRGIWNRLFVHTDQLEVADTEQNRQPFLQDFGRLGPQWVTTVKPRGRTFTTAGVMTTDAVTGKTRVWRARRGQSLIGNQRALDIVRGESFPGIDFAAGGGAAAGGKFRVVEPRQVFPGGRLRFLLSIIPNAANRVTMSVVVDPESQRVTGTYPATPEGDADLIAYLRSGRQSVGGEGYAAPPLDRPSGDDGGAPARAGEGTDPAVTLRRLLRENRAEQRRAAGRVSDLEAQERDLLRLLRGVGSGP